MTLKSTLLAAALALFGAAAAAADEWPTKPLRIATPFPAGAGPQAVLRGLHENLQ